MSRVQVTFDGVSRGAEQAAVRTRAAIRGVGDEAGKQHRPVSLLGSGLSSLAKSGLLAAGALGVGALVATFRSGMKEISEHQRVVAQTGAVLKSTGGQAHVTARQVDGLATALSRMSGVDDEAIAAGENLLLTFRHVRNEAGAGNDVFAQATKAALDMSVALGTDLKSNVLQLGKALDAPAQGMTALMRAGVTFTKQQRDQVKALVEHGKTLEAQKLILAEVNKEFAGSAKAAGETLPGQLAKLRTEWGNLSGMLVQALVPALTRVVEGLTQAITWTEANWPRISKTISEVVDKVKPILDGFVEEIRGLVKLVKGLIDGDWGDVWSGMKAIVTGAIDGMVAYMRLQWDVARKVAVILAQRIVDGIREGLSALAALVADKVRAGIDVIAGAAGSAAAAAKNFGGRILAGAVEGITGIADRIGDRLGNAVDAVRDRVASAGAAARAFGARILDGAIDGLTGIAGRIGDRLQNGVEVVAGLADNAYRAATRFGSRILSGIVDGLAGLAGRLVDAILAPINAIIGRINAIKLPGVSIHVPGVKVAGKTIVPDVNFATPEIDPFPGNIPMLARGGIVTRATLAMIGEAGPEAVIPLSRQPGGYIDRAIVPQLDRAAVAAAAPTIVFDVGGITISGVIDGRRAADEFVDQLSQPWVAREVWRRLEPESRRLMSMSSDR